MKRHDKRMDEMELRKNPPEGHGPTTSAGPVHKRPLSEQFRKRQTAFRDPGDTEDVRGYVIDDFQLDEIAALEADLEAYKTTVKQQLLLNGEMRAALDRLLDALVEIAAFDDSEYEQDRITSFRWEAVRLARAAVRGGRR